MQFIADNMLGKLAKWLRFMGYDILYPKTMDDKDLINISRTENRYLLTRDKELARVKDLNVIYIESEYLDNQLKQLTNTLNLAVDRREFTRCPECNYLLKELEKSRVEGKVPPGVFERQDKFWTCENCSRYYWCGTHYKKIKTKLDELFS